VHASLANFVPFEIYTTMLKNISVFWDMILSRLVVFISVFKELAAPHHHCSPRKLDFPEDGGSKLLWNLSTCTNLQGVCILEHWSLRKMF
jgi:hypothetical protein